MSHVNWVSLMMNLSDETKILELARGFHAASMGVQMAEDEPELETEPAVQIEAAVDSSAQVEPIIESRQVTPELPENAEHLPIAYSEAAEEWAHLSQPSTTLAESKAEEVVEREETIAPTMTDPVVAATAQPTQSQSVVWF